MLSTLRANFMEKKETKRGGARPGAGRPITVGKAITFRPSLDVADLLRDRKDKSAFINECIRRHSLTVDPMTKKTGTQG